MTVRPTGTTPRPGKPGASLSLLSPGCPRATPASAEVGTLQIHLSQNETNRRAKTHWPCALENHRPLQMSLLLPSTSLPPSFCPPTHKFQVARSVLHLESGIQTLQAILIPSPYRQEAESIHRPSLTPEELRAFCDGRLTDQEEEKGDPPPWKGQLLHLETRPPSRTFISLIFTSLFQSAVGCRE